MLGVVEEVRFTGCVWCMGNWCRLSSICVTARECLGGARPRTVVRPEHVAMHFHTRRDLGRRRHTSQSSRGHGGKTDCVGADTQKGLLARSDEPRMHTLRTSTVSRRLSVQPSRGPGPPSNPVRKLTLNLIITRVREKLCEALRAVIDSQQIEHTHT